MGIETENWPGMDEYESAIIEAKLCFVACNALLCHLQSFALSHVIFAHIFLDYFVTGRRNQDAHHRAEDVEEAEGQVGEGRYTQDGGLGHAAGIPRDECGGDGHGIFGGSAQQAAFVTLLFIDVAEHVAQQDDADVLVCRGQIEEESGAYG